MKKKTAIDISICVLMTFVCLFSFFDSKIVVNLSHDLTFHLNRFVGLANAFEEGQILPKIYPYANYGFGYASPLFYCDLFLYPFGILYQFGLSAIWCYKLCILFYTTLGNIFVYLIIKKETNDRKLSLLATFLYLTCSIKYLFLPTTIIFCIKINVKINKTIPIILIINDVNDLKLTK